MAEQNRIDRFLKLMNDRGASDLHFAVGRPPMLRVQGTMEQIRYRTVKENDLSDLIKPITPQHRWQEFEETGDADFSYQVDGVGRFRVNLLKSTTLAAIIDLINERKSYHIVTIEDPIEFVHPNKNCLIHQREVGSHTSSFSEALHAAGREDPDVILVGELRDLETISMALSAAERGTIVLATLHTNNAIKTVDRIVSVFPAGEQEGARNILAEGLQAIVSQQLLPKVGGGRVAALEIVFVTPAISNLIRRGKISQITSLIQSGVKLGMIEMDNSIRALYETRSYSRTLWMRPALRPTSPIRHARQEIDQLLFLGVEPFCRFADELAECLEVSISADERCLVVAGAHHLVKALRLRRRFEEIAAEPVGNDAVLPRVDEELRH
jgi:twitching motility protein PilT